MTTIRVGCGFDVHPFAEGRRLVLGGVHIPHARGLDGHSDADVLTHAVCDALLGALALGDIGTFFPDSSPQYKDADSLALLRQVHEKLQAHSAGVKVVNVDTTIALQAPMLAPHIAEMRANLAACLQCTVAQVGVKATTTERLGFVGREEGAAAYAVALLDVPVL